MRVIKTEGLEKWCWTFQGCGRLVMWDANKPGDYGRVTIGYKFFLPRARTPLFEGEDYSTPLHHAIDSRHTVAGLLAFLTLGEGDTDEDYFSRYTAAQLDFRDSNPIREELAMRVHDTENPEGDLLS